jgi:hypothetical protein
MRMLLIAAAAALVSLGIAGPAHAGEQALGCTSKWRPEATPTGKPLPATFLVVLTNPLKMRMANGGFRYSTIVIPAGAQISVRYGTGSHDSRKPAFATTSLTLPQRLLPGRRSEIASSTRWNRDCTALATW